MLAPASMMRGRRPLSRIRSTAILKIDIEGGEQDLFSGDVSWLPLMPIVIVELHDWMLPGQAVARNFLRAISVLDFDFVHVGENVFCFNNELLRAVEVP
jgi:hypothetical protein